MGGMSLEAQIAKLKKLPVPDEHSPPEERRKFVVAHRKAHFKTKEIAALMSTPTRTVSRQRVEQLIARAVELGELEEIPRYARVVASAGGRPKLTPPPKLTQKLLRHLQMVKRGDGAMVPSQLRGVYAAAGLIKRDDSVDAKWKLAWRGRYYMRKGNKKK